MTTFRRWFAWAFLLATIVAQGPHDHRAAPDDLRAEFGSCDESGRHWAGHHAAGPDAGPDACPICQHRLQVAPVGEPPRLLAAASAPAPPAARPGRVESGFPLRQRCRAPPRA